MLLVIMAGKKAKTQKKMVEVMTPGPHAVRNRRRRLRKREKLVSLMTSMTLSEPDVLGNVTRSGISPNPADPRTMVGALAQLGNTTAGRVDTLRILHPCGEGSLPSEYTVKVPDGAVDYSLSYVRRDEYHIPPLPGALNGVWSVQVYHLPFLKRSRLMIGYRAVAPAVASDVALAFDTAFGRNEPGASTGAIVAVYPNWAQVPGATTGVFYFVVPSDALTPGLWNVLTDTSLPFRSVRRVNYGCTTDLDAPLVANQGRYDGAQIAPAVSLGTTEVMGTVPGTPPTQVVVAESDVYRMVAPIVNPPILAELDPRVMQAQARDGAYMPLRPSQPNWPLTPSAEYRHLVSDSQFAAEEVDDAFDIYLQGWLLGVELWTDIAENASLRMKTREILEMVPAVRSVLAPLSTPGHPCDERSASIIREFCRTEPHAYPADYNESNGFWGNLIRGVGSVVSSLGIPVLSGVSKPLADAIAGWVD